VKTDTAGAVVLSVGMGLVILFCRAFPFLFFRDRVRSRAGERFLSFVEKVVPPAAMTVLAFNAIAGQLKEVLQAGSGPGPGVSVLAASVLTALLHLWRRNPLVSIFGGTAAFMILDRLLG
jgi:branched-subunit amino acid transport protein AzlD